MTNYACEYHNESEETRVPGGKQGTVQGTFRSMAIPFIHLLNQESFRISGDMTRKPNFPWHLHAVPDEFYKYSLGFLARSNATYKGRGLYEEG